MIQNALATTEQAKPVTVIALRNQARELGIKGFMRMKKAELQKAIHDFLDAQNENTANEQNDSSKYADDTTQQTKPVVFIVGKTYKNDGTCGYGSSYTVTGKSEKFLFFMSYFLHKPFRKKIHLGKDKNGVLCEYVDDKDKGSPYPAQTVYATALDYDIENQQSKQTEKQMLQQEEKSNDYANENLPANIERKRLYAIEAGKANISEIVQFSREHSHDVLKFNYGVQSMQNILHSGIRLFSPFYAEREILKGMAAQLGIFRRWDEKECYCNDDVLRDLIIQKLQSLSVRIQNQQELKPKMLNNEYRNGAWENALQENLQLIQSCRTRSELTLLLRSFEGATLLEIFRYHHLIPYPYGGGGINDSLTIRDFVEYEFQKREGIDIRSLQPDLLIKALPAHASSPIEKIAHDDLNEGIQQEKQRVIEFALALRDSNDYQCTIQQFDSVRYMNNTVDGFIDTFRMIFDAYDDNHNSENPIVRCEHDSEFRRHVKEQIIFWGRQWAKQDRFSQLKSGKIRQQLQLARLDTWNEIIDDFDGSDSHDDNDDVIDVEFFEVPEKNIDGCTCAEIADINDRTHENSQQYEQSMHKDNSHDVTSPVTIDEWRKTAADLNLSECFRGLRKFRDEIRYSKKFSRKRKFNPPLRKNTLLPGQITIPFEKPYKNVH